MLSHRRLAVLVALAVSPLLASAAPPTKRAELKVTWLGHAAFEIVSPGGTRVLIDPFLRENPKAPAAWRDLSALEGRTPAAILVTHAHGDHASDVPELATRTKAPVVATGEHLRAMKIPEAQQLSINVGGGALKVGDIEIHAVPAMHSSEPGGRPLGFVLTFTDGRSLYHSGDTWLFGDMQLIEALYHPTILLLEAGGNRYGLDPATAALAVKQYFHPTVIIPMHFGTFDPMDSEESVRRAFQGDKRMRILTPGETTPL